MLGSDTEVVLDGEVFGKPADAADAAAMLRRLSGRTHLVISAVSVVSPSRESQAVSVSEVTFAPLDDARIDAYVASGEPHGRAGAYAIQGLAEAFTTPTVRQLFRCHGAAAVRDGARCCASSGC